MKKTSVLNQLKISTNESTGLIERPSLLGETEINAVDIRTLEKITSAETPGQFNALDHFVEEEG
ncbi:MAG: hypothetical protein HOD13_03965, partial [Rhodospirillaceae bacterium]|nr:hypothetical protein [Rhodospirillaceae bacterium]